MSQWLIVAVYIIRYAIHHEQLLTILGQLIQQCGRCTSQFSFVHFLLLSHKDMAKHLKSELTGDLEKLVLASIVDSPHMQAEFLFKAMDGAGTKESTLIQILVPATNAEVKAIAQAYSSGKPILMLI